MGTEIARAEVIEVEARVIPNDLATVADGIRQRMADHLSPEQNRMLDRAIREACGMSAEEPMRDTVRRFLEAKSLAGRSEKTIAYYKAVALEFCNWSEAASVTDVTTEQVTAFLLHKKSGGCKDCTLNNIRRCLSSFFGWCETQDIVHKSVMRRVEPIKTEKRQKHPFSDTDIAKLREACETTRERAIVEFMLCTGARVGEVAGLDRADVDLQRGVANVFGKGRKERRVYIGEQAAYFMQRYFDETEGAEPAFCSESSKGKGYRRIGIHGLEVLVRKLGKRADVANCHPHRFRRTFATNAIRHGMPIEQVQRAMGHEKVDTTLIYAIVDDSDVEHNIRRLVS